MLFICILCHLSVYTAVCMFRLLEECVCEANVTDSPLTAEEEKDEDTLECVCVYLLKCCDTVYIPTVTVSLTHTYTTCMQFLTQTPKHMNTHSS